MNPNDWEFLLRHLGSFELGVLVTGAIGYFFYKDYISSYLGEKAKLQAQIEDLQKITLQVESIKHDFALLVEERKAHNQLRFAALDKRLQAHQDVYSIALQLANTAQHDKSARMEAAKRYDAWWPDNCLFLEPGARKALKDVRVAFGKHPILERNADYDSQNFSENWEHMWKSCELIAEAIGLPPLLSAENTKTQHGHAADPKPRSGLGAG